MPPLEHLWAPWRMAYIESGSEKSAECIFCAFPAAGPEHHREHLILLETPAAFVIMNRFPYGHGHVMIVPRRHVADPNDLAADEYAAGAELVRRATRVLRKEILAHGFNIGMNLGRVAGAGIEHHCHWHVVPRWNGDVNFMPVVAQVRVMSEHLLATYDKLAPAFAALAGG
jgi:ATP adenylyltransferase